MLVNKTNVARLFCQQIVMFPIDDGAREPLTSSLGFLGARRVHFSRHLYVVRCEDVVWWTVVIVPVVVIVVVIFLLVVVL